MAGVVFIVLGVGVIARVAIDLAVSNAVAREEQERLTERFAERQRLAAAGQVDGVFDTGPVSHQEVDVGAFTDGDDIPVLLFDPADLSPAAPIRDAIAELSPLRGDPLGRIEIPALGLDWVVVEGTSAAELRKGPGHIPGSPLPGQPGNAVLSGHRTTYGAPFHRLDELSEGDEIIVETTIGRHRYRVVSSLVVAPTDIWVVNGRDGAWLTLTTCHPKYSSRERLVVFAALVEGPNYAAVEAQRTAPYEPPVPPEG
ncbi:MAG TPA: class E sortase [Acidimicrobiia bacterium]|nr:class E sortase [Acidimicrobiia bacterium]